MLMTISYIQEILLASWEVLQESSFYILIGLLFGGLLKVFLTPAMVASHLGRGRVRPVLKAALFGIPIPLCSCGVLPAAASIKKQGANNGATMAFLISTPETGVDSISISWALLDPIMTVVRPIAAFVSAFVAGVIENFRNHSGSRESNNSGIDCAADSCCDGAECSSGENQSDISLPARLSGGLRYAFTELWGDLAFPFLIGTVLAGIIYVMVPDELFMTYLGGGLPSMLLMLLLGIPLYICATASTPVAAAFILKGVSPGAALVFLLVGPATNVMSVSVLIKLLGKRATGIYLVSIAVVSVLFGLGLDRLYEFTGISAQATMGAATEIVPVWLKNISVMILLVLTVPLGWRYLRRKIANRQDGCTCEGMECDVSSFDSRQEGNQVSQGCPSSRIADFPMPDKHFRCSD